MIYPKLVRLFALVSVALWGPFGCSDPSPGKMGSVSLALTGTSAGIDYQLQAASFGISGETSLLLGPDQTEAEVVETALPVGDYSIELLDGWSLFQRVDTELAPVEAVLLTANPAQFSIAAQSVTHLSFVFDVLGDEVELGVGTLRLSIDVQSQPEPGLVITELMKNPDAVSDSDGEWFELTNTSSSPVDLQGCVLTRDDKETTISSELSVASGQSVVLASSDAPGFVPDAVYGSLTLPNTTAFVLSVSCGGKLLDSIAVDPTQVPNASGHSLSLDPAWLSPSANDDPRGWCDAVEQYGEDFGTPGAPNSSCPGN
jgi:hypothetical protein